MPLLSHQLFKNISSSFFGYIVRLLLAFVFIPYITAVYGESRYGLWVILFQIITYFSLFDFSLNSAIVRFVSKFKAQNDKDNINRILNSAHLLYSAAGFIALLIIYITGPTIIGHLKLDSTPMTNEGINALLVMGIFIFQHFLLTAFGNSLGAFQREDIARFTLLIEEIIRFTAMLYLVLHDYGLVSLAWTITIISFLRHIVNWIILKRKFPEVRFSLKLAGKESIKQILSYSKISFAIAIGWMIMFNTDSFLLGLISSTAAAGVYQPAAQIMLYLRNIVNNIGVPLIPFISHLESQGRFEEIQEVYRKGLTYTFYLGLFLLTGIWIYARDFVSLWLPPEFSDTASIMIILMFGTLFFLPQIIGNAILFGSEKHSRVLLVLIGEAITKLILAFYLVPAYDYLGMALANSIPQVFFYVGLYPYLFYRAIGFDIRRTSLSLVRSGLIAVIVAAAMYIISELSAPIQDWISLFMSITFSIICFVIGAFFIVEPEDKQRLIQFLKKT